LKCIELSKYYLLDSSRRRIQCLHFPQPCCAEPAQMHLSYSFLPQHTHHHRSTPAQVRDSFGGAKFCSVGGRRSSSEQPHRGTNNPQWCEDPVWPACIHRTKCCWTRCTSGYTNSSEGMLPRLGYSKAELPEDTRGLQSHSEYALCFVLGVQEHGSAGRRVGVRHSGYC
jgi:hypothetical protein